jgi:hypothetical protein
LIAVVLGMFAIVIAIAILVPPNKALPFLPLTLVFPFGNFPLHPYFGVLTASTIFLFIILCKVLFISIVHNLPYGNIGILALINFACVVIIAFGPLHSINPLRSTGIGLAMIANFYWIQTLNLDVSAAYKLVQILRAFIISVSIFAVIEFFLKRNLLYGDLYSNASVSILQEWSVYRVTTLLGHPLSNATIFGCFSLFFFLNWISTNAKRDFIAFLSPAIALGLTAARGSIVAYGICISTIILFFPGSHKRAGRYTRILATINMSLLGLFILIRGIEQFRFNSSEGTVSTKARLLLIQRVFEIIPSSPFGFGPGTAQEYFKTNSNTKLIVENSLFEILLGFGIFGGILVFLSVAIVLFGLFHHRSISSVPFLFFLTSTMSYNFVEGNRSGYVVFGILYLLRNFKAGAGVEPLFSEKQREKPVM